MQTDNVDDAGLYIVTVGGILESPDQEYLASNHFSFEIHVNPCQASFHPASSKDVPDIDIDQDAKGNHSIDFDQFPDIDIN